MFPKLFFAHNYSLLSDIFASSPLAEYNTLLNASIAARPSLQKNLSKLSQTNRMGKSFSGAPKLLPEVCRANTSLFIGN